MEKVNLLVAQLGWTQKNLDEIKSNAAKVNVKIERMDIVISTREAINMIKESAANGNPYNVLLIQQFLDGKDKMISVQDFATIKKTVPSIQILLHLPGQFEGGVYLQELFKLGIYTVFFDHDGTMKTIIDLMSKGRDAEEAMQYYRIPEDKEFLKESIGYIEPERVKKIINLLKSPADKLDDALAHINSMITKKQLYYVICKIEDEKILERIYPKRGMGGYFYRKKYQYDIEQQGGGLFRKKKHVSIKDYIVSPEEFDKRLEIVKQRMQEKSVENDVDLSEQVKEIMEKEIPVTTVFEEEPVSEVTEQIEKKTTEDEKLAAMKVLFGKNVTDEMIRKVDELIKSFEVKDEEPEETVFICDDEDESDNEQETIVEKNFSMPENLCISRLKIKDDTKLCEVYHVCAADDNSKATFIASVLAHTYKQKHEDKKIGVISFTGDMEQFTNMPNATLQNGVVVIDEIEYLVIERKQISEIKSRYEAIFVDEPELNMLDNNKDKVFIVTQGGESNQQKLDEAIELANTLNLKDVTLIVGEQQFDDQTEEKIKEKFTHEVEIVNVGNLKSCVKPLKKLGEYLR